MAYLALARKWRPRQFDQVVGQPFVVQALSNSLEQNRLHHAYLFTGTRGVGKTSIARILSKCLNCETGITATPCNTCSNCVDIDDGRFPDLFEIDAASKTKVEDTRDILDNVPYAPVVGRFKIYLIDEVHMLSGHSFNALLKTLEEPPSHVKFLLATTDPQKLPETVLSRCLQFHLSLLSAEDIQQQLAHILTSENIDFESDALALLSKAAKGSLRDALSLLDQNIAFGNGKVSAEQTRAMLGTIDNTLIITLLEALAKRDADKLLDTIDKLSTQGVNFNQALSDLLLALHTITLLQVAPGHTGDKTLQQLAKQFTPEDVQLYYQIGLTGQRDLPHAPTLRSGFEMTLLRMLAFTFVDTGTEPDTKTTSQAKLAQSTSTTQTTQTKPAALATIDNWQTTFSQLGLSGPARMLAEQCALISFRNNTLELGLSPKHAALKQNNIVNRIQAVLAKHFDQPIKLIIKVDTVNAETPAQANSRQTEEQQSSAEKEIYSDNKVQEIIKAFDAKIIKNSIEPIKTGER